MPLRRFVLISSATSLLGVTLPGSGWAADEEDVRLPLIATGPGKHGRMQTEAVHTARQRVTPRAPGQFNPDPGATERTPAVAAPTPRPRIAPPEPVPGAKPAQVAPLPPPVLPTGSPLDLGFPGSTGSPLLPMLPESTPG